MPLLVAAAMFTVLFTWQKGRSDRHAQAREARGAAADVRRRSCTSPIRRSSASPGPRCSSTAATARRRWRCAPTSSTTTRCTSTWSSLSIETTACRTCAERRAAEARRPRLRRRRHHATSRRASASRTTPNVPALLRQAQERGGLERPLDIAAASYFLSKLDLVAGDAPGLSPWRKRLFLATAGLAADPVEYFALPRDRTVLMGSACEV